MAFREFTGELDQPPPSGPVQEFNGQLDQESMDMPPQGMQQPEPSLGAVALNAVPKGVANVLNTPNVVTHLVLKGLASLPGMENVPGIQELADRFSRNGPMELAKKAGLVNPENEPRTPTQRIIDTAIQAATGAAAMPLGGALNAAKSVAMGAAGGAAAGVTKEATGSDLLAGVVGMATPLALRGAANAVTQSSKKINLNLTEQDVLKDGQKYGLVVEPSAARGPASMKESIAGKAALAQETSLKNQPIFNEMASKYIGLPPGTPLTPKLFKDYKDEVAKPFQEVDQVFNQLKQNNQLDYFPRYHSQSLMDEYRETADNARALWKAYSDAPTKDINMLKAARAADATTDGVFKDIEMVANASGDPTLINRLNNARELYARINDVQAATNVGSGNINAQAVGKMLQDGKKFQGELLDMGRFARTFERSSRPKEAIPPPGVSGGDMAMGPVIGAAAGDVKSGVLALGIPGLRQKARDSVLSESYQRNLLKQPSSVRGYFEVPKSSGRIGSAAAGKTVLDNAEE